jgi:hypothetical protein
VDSNIAYLERQVQSVRMAALTTPRRISSCPAKQHIRDQQLPGMCPAP